MTHAAGLPPTGFSPVKGLKPVPVEHRFLGLDRRAFPYAFSVLAVWLLWTVLLPHIDQRVSVNDVVRAGDQLALTTSVAMTPAVGWEIRSGHRLSDSSSQQVGRVVLDSRGVTFVAVPGDFTGTPDQLLDQIDKVDSLTVHDKDFHVSSQRVSLTTDAGDVGVAQAFVSARSEGVIAAVVLDGTGVEFEIIGPPEQLSTMSEEIGDMVQSVRVVNGTGARS